MNTTKANRRTMAHHHMRRSAFFPDRLGGLITEITWIVGNLEVICKWWNRQTILSKIVKICDSRSQINHSRSRR